MCLPNWMSAVKLVTQVIFSLGAVFLSFSFSMILMKCFSGVCCLDGCSTVLTGWWIELERKKKLAVQKQMGKIGARLKMVPLGFRLQSWSIYCWFDFITLLAKRFTSGKAQISIELISLVIKLMVKGWWNIDRVLGLMHQPCLKRDPGFSNWASEAWRSRDWASTQRTLSLLNTGRVKSIRARPELWGCCAMARIRRLSLAEPQPNRTAEPQYVLLDLPPSLPHSSLYSAH